jgi:uncharacterized OB-fold protein
MPESPLQPGARGTLVSFTVIRKAPAAFAGEPIYAVAIVDVAAPAGGGARRVIGRIEPFDPPPRLGAAVALARFAKGIPVFAPDAS